MKTLTKLFLVLGLAASFAGANAIAAGDDAASKPDAELKSVAALDVARYTGTWYEIARNPIAFGWGCACSRQMLTAREDGNLDVYNSCRFRSFKGPLLEVRGVASIADKTTNAKILIDYGVPWKTESWVIALDAEYRYAVIADPKERALHLFSRTPVMEPALYDQAVAEAAAQVDTSKLQKVSHEGCWN